MDKKDLINQIYSAWLNEDKKSFKLLVSDALYQRVNKFDILQYLGDNKLKNRVDEEFKEWAYMFVATEGMSDCPPG